MIQLSRVLDLMNGLAGAEKRAFSIKFVKRSGGIVEGKECVCTSSFDRNKTQNIMFTESKQVRTVRNVSIVEFNGEEVFI